MRLHVKEVLNADELGRVRALLAPATWGDGRATAGVQSAQVKNNEQLAPDSAAAQALQAVVLGALNRHAVFFSAALPKRVFPPLFNRYGGRTNSFGNHVDNAVRFVPGGRGGPGERVRTDISCTLFISDPLDCDGGELTLEDSFGAQSIKLPAGDLLLYPSTSVHRVEAVTRGVRLASVFWIESMVRADAQRGLLFDMDQHLMQLRSALGETDPGVIGLTGTYHNLLRMWADVG